MSKWKERREGMRGQSGSKKRGARVSKSRNIYLFLRVCLYGLAQYSYNCEDMILAKSLLFPGRANFFRGRSSPEKRSFWSWRGNGRVAVYDIMSSSASSHTGNVFFDGALQLSQKCCGGLPCPPHHLSGLKCSESVADIGN